MGILDRKAILFVKQKLGKETIIGAEVGVYEGLNAINILENMPNVKLLYLVDPYSHNFRPHKAIAKKNLAPFTSRIHWIYKEFEVCTTRDIPDPLDFIYIDGNHHYEHVKRDTILSAKLVKKDGVIGGHDFRRGVEKAVKEYCEKNELQFQSIECEDWWFINEKGI